jgi:hypothetical protein
LGEVILLFGYTKKMSKKELASTKELDHQSTIDTELIGGADLESRAKGVLAGNDRGSYIVPAEGLYPHQWLWDSCFISIGLRHYDVERAKIEILSLLRGQWHNGMLPHVILSPRGKDSSGKRLRNASIWRSWVSPLAPDNVSTSAITQPPLLAEAVVRVGKKMSVPERRLWYKMVYPQLLAYHQWLYAERDPHKEGLVLQIHPWETGLDNTPPWMNELHEHSLPWWIRVVEKLRLDTVFGWVRSDRKYVSSDERESNIDALALYDIQRRFRRKNYDFNKILDHSLFAIEDLSFNSIFIRANAQLKVIAKSIREELPPELLESMSKTEDAYDQLWDPSSNEYFSRDFVTHRLLKVSTVATLLPLYSGSISKERAAILVHLLENEHRFGPAYPVPSVPLDSPWFNPTKYWQGPTWLNMNWMIIDGLRRYGYSDHADALRESTLELVERSGFYEYFNPLDGSPAGVPDFSWTAALAIDLLHD